VSATCPYPKPDLIIPYPHITLPYDPFNYYFPISFWVSRVVSPLNFSSQSLYLPLLTPWRHMLCLFQSSSFYLTGIIWFGDKKLNNTICRFLNSPFTSSSLCLNILRSAFNFTSLPHALISSAGIDKHHAIHICKNFK